MKIVREPISRNQPKTLANGDIRSAKRTYQFNTANIALAVRDSKYEYFVTLKREEIFLLLHTAVGLSKLDTASNTLAQAAIGILIALIPDAYPQK